MILVGALLVSTVGGWARGASADADRVPATGPELLGELRELRQQLDAKQGELDVARLQLDRANAIIQYSAHYRIPADLATAIYDVALSEGIDPGLAFRLVKVESGFTQRAKSRAGAVGFTHLLAYNRGPGKVEELLGAGRDPQNGYATSVMKGFRHR